MIRKTLAGGFALILAVSAATAWGQTSTQSPASSVSATVNVDSMDQEVAQKVSQAWSEGKDASGAAAFQENGEIALSEGNRQLAERYFEAAQRELAHLNPSPVSAPSNSAF